MAADNNLESRQSFRNTQNEGELDTLNLADIWAMIWNNKWWYVLSICICIFFAVFYIYRTSPTFSRTAKVIIDDSNENSALRDLASFTGGLSRMRSSGSNVMEQSIIGLSARNLARLTSASGSPFGAALRRMFTFSWFL